jgi:hypothetical protein
VGKMCKDVWKTELSWCGKKKQLNSKN